jgi:hypothetical protein
VKERSLLSQAERVELRQQIRKLRAILDHNDHMVRLLRCALLGLTVWIQPVDILDPTWGLLFAL